MYMYNNLYLYIGKEEKEKQPHIEESAYVYMIDVCRDNIIICTRFLSCI